MMKKTKTDKRMKWNYMMVLPVLFLAMIALSVPKLNASILEKESDETVGKGMEERETTEKEIKDFVMITGNVDLSANPFGLGETKIVPKDSVKTLKTSNFSITGFSGKNKPLIIVDDKIVTSDELQQLKPDDIESISILKEKSAIEMYGDEGKDGVILIETKKSNRNVLSIGSGSMDSLRGDVKSLIIRAKENSPQNSDQFGENPPLIIVDGEKMPKDFELNSINPNDIESMSVLKDKSATDIYGEEGKNGVVLIMTKENLLSRVGIDDKDKKLILKVSTYKSGEVLTFGNFNNAVIFINGRKSSLEQLQQLHSNDVTGMAVSPQDLDLESDLHKKYKIPLDKNIIEVTVK